jgi:hypothetical protein
MAVNGWFGKRSTNTPAGEHHQVVRWDDRAHLDAEVFRSGAASSSVNRRDLLTTSTMRATSLLGDLDRPAVP